MVFYIFQTAISPLSPENRGSNPSVYYLFLNAAITREILVLGALRNHSFVSLLDNKKRIIMFSHNRKFSNKKSHTLRGIVRPEYRTNCCIVLERKRDFRNRERKTFITVTIVTHESLFQAHQIIEICNQTADHSVRTNAKVKIRSTIWVRLWLKRGRWVYVISSESRAKLAYMPMHIYIYTYWTFAYQSDKRKRTEKETKQKKNEAKQRGK